MAANNPIDVEEAGERAMVAIYVGDAESLDEISSDRKSTWKKVASQNEAVQPSTLPPTSAAAKFHSFRVFHQVIVRKNLTDSAAEGPIEWCWQMIDNALRPISIDCPPAPEKLLKVIACQYKGDCSSLRCTCCRHGLNCSSACNDCQEELCSDIPSYVFDDLDVESESECVEENS